MANALHVAKLEEGARAWNAWRADNPGIVPDLSELNLSVGRRQFGPIQGGPVDLSRADLSGAALEQATLIEANLAAALLAEADLSHARMENADLRGANLSNANLDQTNLKGAQLGEATLSGARLRHARNLTQAQIDQSTGDQNTTLPPGLTMPQTWLKAATFSRLARRTGDKASVPKGDPHSVLGVRRRASTREIRAAYLRLAKELHPDGRLNDPVAAERLKVINDAYQELKGFGGRAQARRAEREDLARRARKGFLAGFLVSAPVLLAMLGGFYYAGYIGPSDVAPRTAAMDRERSKQAVGIREIAWAEAERIGTREALQGFIEAFPDGDRAVKAKQAIAGIDAVEARQQAERSALAEAERSGTKAAWESFIKAHPDGEHAAKARQTLAAIDAAEARRQAERSALAEAERSGTKAAWESFIRAHPDGEHAGKAKQAIAAIDAAEARQQAERTALAGAQKRGTREAWEGFIEAYPDGEHAAKAKLALAAIELSEARQRADYERDDAAWLKAERRNSKAAYRTYLSAYPNGRRAGDAWTRIGELERVAAKALAEAVIKETKQPPPVLRPSTPEPTAGQRWPSADEPFIGADGRIRR